MMSFLQTGKALYVLAVICFGGIFVRLAAGSFYKKLIKESANMALTKNRYLRNLKQNAEDTYRINMGMNNAAVYLQRQLGNLKFLGFSLSGLENLAGQLTLLSFLAGGVCAFLSYWNRSDNSYIVLYGAAGILGGMLCYPIASMMMGQKAALFTFVGPFLASTVCGTVIAAVIITALYKSKAVRLIEEYID